MGCKLTVVPEEGENGDWEGVEDAWEENVSFPVLLGTRVSGADKLGNGEWEDEHKGV